MTTLMCKKDYEDLLDKFGLKKYRIREGFDMIHDSFCVRIEFPFLWKNHEKRILKKAIKRILKLKGVGIYVRFFVKGKEWRY